VTVLVVVLLAIAVFGTLASGLGVLVFARPLDRLHFTGLATLLGTLPLTVAALVQARTLDVSVKVLVVAALVLLGGPVLNTATGRAIVTRERGAPTGDGWEVTR
jgi:multisubunit Na+/H+ antiporter MnhG subunit